MPESIAVQSGGRRIGRTVRPIMPGHEDEYARAEARRRSLVEMADVTVRKVCKGSPAKLAKQIAKASSGS